MNESKHECQQIDRQGVNIGGMTDCKVLEEYRKPRSDFTSPSLGNVIGVIRESSLIKTETWWVLRNAPSVQAEKKDQSSGAYEKSPGFLSYTGAASSGWLVVGHSLRLLRG